MRCNRNLAKFFLALVAINIFSLTYLRAYSGRDIELSEPEEYVIENDIDSTVINIQRLMEFT